MKKFLSALPIALCVVYLFLPLCELIGMASGHTFILYHTLIYMIVIAVITLTITLTLFLCKHPLNMVGSVCSVLALPLSILNGLFFVFGNLGITFALAVFSFCCTVAIFVKFGAPKVLKYMISILSGILIVIMIPVFLFYSIFGNFSNKSILNTVYSPNNTYVAKVIDSDQGALGGNTIVEVSRVKNDCIFILIGEFSTPSNQVYIGAWQESLQLKWQDEYTLIINGETYEIK